jgi:ribosomal protein S18 acetylase RimI-like enzyme
MPDNTVSNIKEIANQQDKWEKVATGYRTQYESGKLSREIASRAVFAADVLWQAGNMVSQGEPGVWLAISDSDIVGVIIHTHKPGGEIYINYAAIAPQFHSGSPNGDKPKGIGTTMLEAIRREAQEQSAPKLTLNARDEKALAFWQSHGFSDSLPGHLMKASPAQVYCYIADNPDADDVVLAGIGESIPGFRAMTVKSKELPVIGETQFKVMPGLERTGKIGATIMGRRDLPPVIDKRWYSRGKDLPWVLAHEIGHQCIYDIAKAIGPSALDKDDVETSVARWMVKKGVDYTKINFREPTLVLYAANLVTDLRVGRRIDHVLAGEFVAEVVAHYITTYDDPMAYHLPKEIEDVIKTALEMPPYQRGRTH